MKKNIIYLMLALLLPAVTLAQDTTVVKKQAGIVAKAVTNGDYGTVIDYMYPKVVQMSGGKAKLLQMLTQGMNQMKAQGVSFKDATVGSPGKFHKAGTEIHCLVPEYITMKAGASTIRTKSNLLAVSRDRGKSWTFLDLNKNTIAAIPKIFPHFNKDLKIPEPTQPFVQ